MQSRLRFLVAMVLAMACSLAQDPQELAIRQLRPVLDGNLEEWAGQPSVVLGEATHVVGSKGSWSGVADSRADLQVAFDATHLYLAGQIEDDQILPPGTLTDPALGDCIELHLGFAIDGDAATRQPEDAVLRLMPLDPRRPYEWVDHRLAARPSTAQLGGIRVLSRRLSPTRYSFEAAIPFHHYPALQPGAPSVGFSLSLRDHDPADGPTPTVLAWCGRDPGTQKGLGLLHFQAPGPLQGDDVRLPLLDSEWLADMPYLLVPLSTIVLLVLMLRVWPKVRARAPWLRPTLMVVGVVLCTLGLFLPGWMQDWRADTQRGRLDATMQRLSSLLLQVENGTLKSYRGQSRDRAFVQLLQGEAIARQRYTSYRSLAQIAPEQFGPAFRHFDDLPVRPYWLPLVEDQPESFQFDPPLRGQRLHLVVARPFTPAFSFAPRPVGVPRLELALDFVGADSRRLEVDLDRPFVDGQSLGRDHWEVCVVPVGLERDLRGLTANVVRGVDFRLVGISLEGSEPGRIEPVMLGTPTRGGVLTDLRGPWPVDAGIELAPGATAKVAIPRTEETPQRLWFFYRAIYPGVPTAILGEKVAEIVLHFGGKEKRTIPLEHQVSVFYELAFRNTRDAPPDDSPASLALDWLDEAKERHVNLGYPVNDLPSDAPLEAIEFRNVADYRMHFRSVVFVHERQAAPQDPPDSPLVRTANGMTLPPQRREEILGGAAVTIYRDGRLSESMFADEARAEAMYMPRAVANDTVSAETPLPGGGRRLALFMPLRGDGWDGATIGVADTDPDHAAAGLSANRWGFALCLLSAPFLLVLLSEWLAAATSLRARLMTVTSLASLAPLALLSLVLVQVLESGHAADVEAGMRDAVASAREQLGVQKQKVQASAQQWLQALVKVAGQRLAGVAEADFDGALGSVGTELEQRLQGQLPPEWHGGFLRLEWQPALGQKRSPPRTFVAGNARASDAGSPARLEPGLFMDRGELRIGVRAEQVGAGGTYVLTAGRPVEGNLLAAIAPGQDVLLTDVRGYPLAVATGRSSAESLQQQALDPVVMMARERALGRALEAHEPVVERHATANGSQVHGSEVLLDLQDTPRALLVLARPDERAMLDLAVGRIPVRGFFLLVAGSLVVLSVFLSFVVSGRISRPIERLERGAQALSRGQLETRVQVDDGGQIGALTRAFNQMAADLQGRLQDLQAINRTMRELSGEHDEATSVDVLRRFCQAQTPADSVHVVLADPTGQRLVLHSGTDRAPRPMAAPQLPLATMVGPFVCHARTGVLPEPWGELAPDSRSLLAVPIVFGGQTRGLVVLGFAHARPTSVDLDLLSTVVAQAAVAFERCQLQKLAVQDPVTGMFTPDYFRRRIADEVSLAQQRGRPLVLLAVALGDGERRPRGLRRFAALLGEHLGASAVSCHTGSGQFLAALPGTQRAHAEARLLRLADAWDDMVRQSPENELEAVRPAGVVVQFPDEAASTEFLFEALAARIAALREPGASAMESDESLQRAGVTAVSPAMRAVYGTLRRVAPTDLPILFEGETGVGKEVLTNLVHRWSRRAGGPLVKVHCASLSETLLASELFGHEKGAFTGADRRKIGRFEQADGGTLFLDEVGEIPLDVQVKLLRVLQEGEVDRVGGSDPVKVDVRVVAATNRDIARMVGDGRFREDLYYRLQGMVVKVPPLRERKQELASLIDHFRDEIVADGHTIARTWSTDAMDEMFRQEWPGNIRQLRHTVFRAMVLARGEVVQLRDLQSVLAAGGAGAGAGSGMVATSLPASVPPAASVSPSSPPSAPAVVEPGPAPHGGDGLAQQVDPLVLDDGPGAADDAAEEPIVLLPRVAGEPLPPRLEELRRRIVLAGRYTTQEHMAVGNLSHRTALRDLQALVTAGVVERVGARRGAFYRPLAGG
ncbi:MAG: sigma 54-interacting transcriptional regulator [Planctomycetes bacterium]|nr:sigma 54-interacting transcriptional regulator [Planctomycetota bacterium]